MGKQNIIWEGFVFKKIEQSKFLCGREERAFLVDILQMKYLSFKFIYVICLAL